MADFTVNQAASLGSFLRQQGMQQWRIPRMLGCNGIRVQRGWISVTNLSESTPLQSQDLVHVNDPLSPACDAAINRSQNTDFRDYAFAPGTTPFDQSMAALLDLRPQTVRITDPFVDTLTAFVRALSSNTAVRNPIRDLIIASHANPEGLLFLHFGIASPNRVTFEDLEGAVQSGAIRIAPGLLQPRPTDIRGSPEPPRLLVRGCRVGVTLPYLRKLKEAFGNQINVIAPKHFHVTAQLTRPAGRVESMAYSFNINRPKRFRDRQEAIAEFNGKRFLRINGSAVPAQAWAEWIPRNPNQGIPRIQATVINPVTNASDNAGAEYRYQQRQFLDSDGSMGLPADPGTDTGRKQAVRDELRRQYARYRDKHPFPEYVRFGYGTMDEFMDGWTWSFRYDQSNQTLYFNATRHEYTVVRPIVDPPSNRLFLNFYPTTTMARPTKLLDEADGRFFATV